VIPVRGIRVPLLLSAGGQDAVWDSAEAVDSVMYQLDAVPGALAHTDLYFPDAGHAVAGSPPDFPLDEDGLGGSPDADALAAERFWPRMLAFVDDAHRRQGGSG
jgi:dienelactone hydrolase